MARNRFINIASLELQESNRNPIFGYQHLPILTLEETIEKIIPLIPGIKEYVLMAKENCNRNTTLLTWNESAAIYLYSMSIPFFSRLNTALRAENRHELKPWFAFLKLFITALEKLPTTKGTVWRGVNYDDTLTFVDNDVHIWWSINSCSMAVNIVQPFLGEKGTLFVIDASHGKDISAFSAISEEQEIVLMPGTRVRAKCQSLSFIDQLFVVHLEAENLESELQTESSYLFELIKHEYQRNSRIERIMNPSKSFPIEQSYINLAIVESKEHQEKEKKLLNAKLSNEIIGTYEEIYGIKTRIEIKNIFEKCQDQTKNILVLGRAGIGKTTFCRYVAYQWATGVIWPQYQLVIFIRLRRLTESRYPPLASGIRYSLIDLIKTEYCCHNLSEKDEKLLKEQFESTHILWLLDGYDEIVQNVPSHLRYLLEQLLKTSHHILTSRPYMNTLSYNVQLEIIGFTDDNIKEYVKQFFDQIKEEIENASLQVQRLLGFLRCNPRIWGIVHIPVNLELICSLWCDTDWSDTTALTMTIVYDKMIEWLCRRHLKKQHISSNQMTKEDVYEHCSKALTFYESLAFNGMKSNTIILRPQLLRAASKESQCSLQSQPDLLNIGILKSLDYKPIGTHIEAEKNHYFVHLSFQEHFAARYLVKALNGNSDQKKKAIDFIKSHKYNQRFILLFTFASGLITDNDDEQYMNTFWDLLFREPLDVISLRHVEVVISCLEEAGCNRHCPRFQESMNLIIKWIKYSVSKEHDYFHAHMKASLQRCTSLVNQSEILHTLLMLHQKEDLTIKKNTYILFSDLPISNPDFDLIHLHLTALDDRDDTVRQIAYDALGRMGEKAATNEVITRFVSALEDTNNYIRWKACEALGKMGERAVTDEVINKLVSALEDTNQYIRCNACETLGKFGKKAITNEVINRLVSALGDRIPGVRLTAWDTLQKMNKNAPNSGIMSRVINALGDVNRYIRRSACEIVGKLDSKTVTNEIIDRLVCALGDTNPHMRRNACEALSNLINTTATDKVIKRLINALGDTNHYVRRYACEVFGKLNGKSAIKEVINGLVNALEDSNADVRRKACISMGECGAKIVSNQVIEKLMHILEDTNSDVRCSAYEALGNMAERAATKEVINRVNDAVDDTDDHVRRTALEALGKLGEKAATSAIVESLLNEFGDSDNHIRRIACEAVGRVGVKTATYEVIETLIRALEDEDHYVRRNACEALGKLDKIRQTDDVIKCFMTALADTHPDVRRSACETLQEISEEAVTYEVISRLVMVHTYSNYSVRLSACKALETIGKKEVSPEVVTKLLNALENANLYVKWNACEVVEKLAEKVATNEVINGLVSAVDDSNFNVRRSAWAALGSIGEKAATNALMNRFVNVFEDTDACVRRNACEAIAKMGRKAATNEVINKLLDSFEDRDEYVRRYVCEAVGNMGEKAATNEVIHRLVIALRDKNHCVRRSACEALEKMGERAITYEVINTLVSTLEDSSPDVRRHANAILCKIDDKIATNELLRQLLTTCNDRNPDVQYGAIETTGNILSLLSCKSHFDDFIIEQLSMLINRFKWKLLDKLSLEKFVKVFLETKITSWLSVIKQISILQGNAVTISDGVITLYGNNEPVEVTVVDIELEQKIKNTFINWMDELS